MNSLICKQLVNVVAGPGGERKSHKNGINRSKCWRIEQINVPRTTK